MKAILAEKLLTQEEFDGATTYLRIRVDSGLTLALAHGFHVQGLPLRAIAEQNDCTRQNVVHALQRFAVAYERYIEVQAHLAKSVPVKKGRPSLPPAVKTKKPAAKNASKPPAPVKKSALKPAGKKVVAPASKKAAAKKPAARARAASR
ncbi:hypothetical protein [Variovorax sp. KK3]|uniref:hypothetical protein n=1 Tax=Variovorax sp. KK3 TaxID=1855728 RepID=UPI00097C8CF7|nr:hypothetical protein [Variovorax sp. KK3]